MSICQRIFDYTGHDNTKLHALAKTLGVAASTVSTWKARHTDPPAKYIMPIAEFLGVSPLWLLTGTPEPAAAQKSNTSFSLYDELHAVYDSLDRPGQVIMLAAGYKEQLRVKGNPSQKIEAAPPPRKFVLKIKNHQKEKDSILTMKSSFFMFFYIFQLHGYKYSQCKRPSYCGNSG